MQQRNDLKPIQLKLRYSKSNSLFFNLSGYKILKIKLFQFIFPSRFRAMNCGSVSHSKFKSLDRYFVEFWHEYFRSTGHHVRDLPIKYFLSATDLLHLCDLTSCTCSNLIEKLYPPVNKCEVCRKKFASRVLLERHMYHHKLKKERFECVFCMKTFQSKLGQLRHIELHTADYRCEPCNKPCHSFDIERHNATKKHLKNVERFEQKPKRKLKRRAK